MAHANPYTPGQVETLEQAQQAKFRHLCRKLRLQPGDYLLDWRLRRARLLLREGLDVAEVATAVGYGSAAALTRIFSQRLGQAPARWRREQAVRSRVSAQ